jgi:hypothetical protein
MDSISLLSAASTFRVLLLFFMELLLILNLREVSFRCIRKLKY